MNARPKTRRPSAPSARRSGPEAWLWLLGALACAAALWLTYWAFVRTATGQYADEAAFREASLRFSALKGTAADLLDYLPYAGVAAGAVVVAVLCLRRRSYLPGIVALGSAVAANLSTQLLKNVLWDRPDTGVRTLDFNSLPSGHTTLAASAAAAVFLVLPPRWRPLAGAAGGTFTVLVGVCTFLNLWHRPADILAAYLVAAFWALIGGLVLLSLRPERRPVRSGGGFSAFHRFWPRLCWLAGLGGTAAAVVLYLAAGERGPSLGGISDGTLYFFSGLGAIIGTGYLVFALALWLFSRHVRSRAGRNG